MLRTIRNKIVFGIFILILAIQIISSGLQAYQVRSIFLSEFVFEAQNLSNSVFTDLYSRLENNVGEVNETSPDEINEMMQIFMRMIQFQSFGSILQLKEDLQSIMFINDENSLMNYTSRGETEVIHKNKDNDEDLKIDPLIIPMIDKKEINSLELDNQVLVFVPYYLNDNYFGGIVLTFSSQRLGSAQKQIFLTSLILALVFSFIAIALVLISLRAILTRRIKRMIFLVKKLANGEFDESFAIRHDDEIGEMGKSINELVSSLQVVFESISDVMGSVENGDLSRQIEPKLKGELETIKTRINQSISMLSSTISAVRDTSESVETSAGELADSAELLSNTTAKQVTTLKEISSSIEAIEKHSQQNTRFSQEAKKISNHTLEMVNSGNRQMIEMQDSMSQINSTSMDVTKIINVIDEIAFQTNLLALNAAVEAARAGKYGKGFAVVADEVRNLASRSAEAARTSSSLIESSMKEVEAGVEKAAKTAQILNEIVAEVEKSDDLISKIAEGSHQQSSGISEIFNGISLVNDRVLQNSKIAQQTAESSDLLLTQSNNLQQEIQRFTLFKSVPQPDDIDDVLALPNIALSN